MALEPTRNAAPEVQELTSLLHRALELELSMRDENPREGDQDPDSALAAQRLSCSVIRPLREAVDLVSGTKHQHGVSPRKDEDAPAAAHGDGSLHENGSRIDAQVWQLAADATRLRLSPDLPLQLQEATAALQDLALRLEPEGSGRAAELRAIQAELPRRIQSQPNGPYLVTNAERLTNWLGESLPARPQMALCRCGSSAIKPYCDGTHAEIGFRDRKDPARVPDRRDTYVGQQVTILDNRGICQHSGFCSDRLAAVFRAGADPFVAPSGGRMDEIIRAVRDCPSGALSYAIDGVEARDSVDYHGRREPAIEVSRDGPYRITGGIPLTDGRGDEEPRNAGATSEHYALCRCGHSQNKPFCSGMHWRVEFKDPVHDADGRPTIFEWAGGLPALTRMTRIFYERYVPEDPLLAPLFAHMSPDHPQRVAKWLGEVFCGPRDYSEQYGGYPRMISQHLGKGLTEEKRARWVELILRSAQDAGLPADPEFRSAFGAYIEWGSRLALENSQPGARPPGHMPMPHWDWNTAAGPPGSRISALASTSEEEQAVVMPGADEAVSFEKHIKTLFRQRDRQSMQWAFDLWAYDEVRQHAEAILERLKNGSMPCDGAWPQAKLDAFERWVATGTGP